MVLDTKKSTFGRQEWLWFYTVSLYYKIRQILQNGTAIFSRNRTIGSGVNRLKKVKKSKKLKTLMPILSRMFFGFF